MTMRAFRFDALRSLDNLCLHDEIMPEPQRGEVLIKVHAVSLNFRDIAPVLGRYVWDAKPGLIPCSDAAGEVIEVGESVDSYKVGDKVISTFHPRWFGGRAPSTAGVDTYGSGQDGWLAEYKVVSQEAMVRLPDSLSYEQGATLPCAGVTAWNALTGGNPLRPGQTVLTQGGGGVSVFSIQLAKAFGATVIATTLNDKEGDVLKTLGVDTIINSAKIEEWGRYIKTELTCGIGVDCVVEVVGPATINRSLDAVRWGGEVVLIGFLSEKGPSIDYFHLKGSGATVRSIGVGDRAMLEDLVRAVEHSGLKPVIDQVFDFSATKEAFEHLLHGERIGKVVICLNG